MCTKRSAACPDQRGVTLIELIMFIVIITVGLVGILTVMNITTRSSADPMIRKQATAMAEAVLEEVLSKSYCDPDLVAPNCGVSREASRADYDDIEDYNGQTIAGNITLGAISVLAAGYTATIRVAAAADVSGVTMRRITVTVNGGGETISLFGYRAAGF
jgi:MSHA pilin protein MshD